MQGTWIRKPTGNCTVVFVHGILSNGEDCWKNKETGAYWLDLLKDEQEFEAVGIYAYSYQTSFFSGTYSLNDVVTDIKERLFHLDDVIVNQQQLVFVAHSMGGIVVRKLVVERLYDFQNRQIKIGLFLVSSPSLGSDYANFGKLLSYALGNSQAKALRFSDTNEWLNDLHNAFKNIKESKQLEIIGKELVEDKPVYKMKLMPPVVKPFSAAQYFGEYHKIPNSDHFSIAKPKNKEADQHRHLLVFLRKFNGSGKPSNIIATSTNTQSPMTSPSTITASNGNTELEQLRAELDSVSKKKLDDISAKRSAGQIDSAWEELTIELASLNGRTPEIKARYYYYAARWAQEDDKPAEQYRRYYETAQSLNSKLDDRTYRAFEFKAKKQFDEAIAILLPLDSEIIAVNLLSCLLDSGRFLEVDVFIDKLETPITAEIQRFHALCCLAAKNADKAWQIFEPILAQNVDSIFFQLAAAYIIFWQAIPSEFHIEGVLSPQFSVANMFSLNREREQQMRVALRYVEQALANTTEPRREVKEAVISAYLVICTYLPDKHEAAINKAKSVLTDNLLDYSALLCLIRLDVNDYDWTRSCEALHQACEQPNAPTWQIGTYPELLLLTGKNDAAWQHLTHFEYRFLSEYEGNKLYWFDLAIRCLDPLERLPELEERIAVLDDSVQYQRIKAAYWLTRHEDVKALSIAQTLAQDPATRLDCANLVNLYYQKRMWQEVMESASLYLERFKEESPAQIVDVLVQAWYALNQPKTALTFLEQYKSLFECDGRLDDYYNASVTVQHALGQYAQAWQASEPLWQALPSEELLLRRAYFQVMLGDTPRAIELLKQGIEQGFKTAKVLIQLAHYALTNDRETAFEYAKEAVNCFPDDPHLLQAAMMIGFNSGHSDWAGLQLGILQQKFPNSGLMKQIKLPQLLEWGRENQERSQENWQKFRTGQLPLHLWLDSRNTPLSAEFYWRWHHNHSKPLREHIHFPIAYAGRSVEPDHWNNNAISMDYSACLIAHQLKLFPSLADNFEVIYVAPSLLGLIIGEIHRLAEVQTDRVEQAEKLLNDLDILPITFLPAPCLELGDFNGLQLQDRVEWALATQKNLLIVSDLFATELFESGSIPADLEKLRVSYADLFTALANRGELSLDDNPVKGLFTHPADSTRVAQLTNGTKLLVDSACLHHFNQANVLEAASRVFQLHCLDDIKDQFRNEIESYQYRQKIKKSLELLQTELRQLLRKGKVQQLTLRPNPAKQDNALHKLPLANELTELFFSEAMNCPVWIDDRLLSSYHQLSEHEPIVGIYDVLLVLYTRKKITDGKFLECFRQLIRAGVGYRVPPAAYLIEELMQATMDSKLGTLIENSHLTNLRLTVALSLGSESILNKHPLRQDLQPERQDYQFQLHCLVNRVMVAIWTTDKLNQQQRVAYANWLYEHFLPQQGRPVLWDVHADNCIQGLAIEHSFRMSLVWQFIESERAIAEYYDWLFTRLEPVWRNQPFVCTAAIERFAELIIAQLQSFSQQKIAPQLIAQWFVKPLQFCPNDVLEQLLSHPKIEPHFQSYFSTGCYIESLSLFFTATEWTKFSEDCINKGTIESIHQDRRITLMFKPRKGINDSITLSTQAANGQTIAVNMLSPYCRLEHPLASQRIGWLDDMIQSGLLNTDDDAQYRIRLQSDDFRLASETLKKECQRSGDVFFAYARLTLGIQNIQRVHFTEVLPPIIDIIASVSPITVSAADTAHWLFATQPEQTKKRLVALAALPYGTPWDLATAVKQALADHLISVDALQAMVSHIAQSSLNPIVLQNLLSLSLQLPEIAANAQTETLIQTLLTLNPNPITNAAFELYIKLLHVIWLHFQLTPAFATCHYPYEQRVTWAYIYADRMLDSLLQRNSHDGQIASNNIDRILNTLKTQVNHFEDIDNEVDVILPSAASGWRTVIGGTLGTLLRNTDSLANFKQTIIDLVEPLLEVCYNALDDKKLNNFDFFEPTDYLSNFKNSVLSNQSWKLAVRLRAQLNGQPEPSEIQPMLFCQNTIKEGNDNAVTDYLSILARYPIPTEMVELLINSIGTLINKPFNQANKRLFLAQSAILGRLTSDRRALDLRQQMIQHAIEGLAKDFSLWSAIPDLSIQLYRFDTGEQRIHVFITTLREIARVIPIEKQEFSDFYAFFIRRIESYIPTKNYPELWDIF
ncbi:hypothetical protein KFZ76_10010 [Methylovulum psychrotolerans]|uniref:HTH domain-containing protein n=1 Tax=Methylovulum psychrotolerans TaxID=1704499 RepID=UPI001BFF85F0|nr:hypothetical protein [Methylovulum psychrotolerans]MBT9098035.1 hypothetical protein [Methylovulum psychrotolerans]